MKIPHRVTPRTQPSSQPLAYLREADTSGIMSGANKIASAFASLGEGLKQRTEDTQRFSALTAFGEFEKQTAQDMLEFQRNSAPDDMQFVENWETNFNKRKAEFVTKQPAAQPVQAQASTMEQEDADELFADEPAAQIPSMNLKPGGVLTKSK